MRRSPCLVPTIALAATLSAGCFPFGGNSSSSDGGTAAAAPFSTPTLELTVNGVHFGPSVPDPGASADLVTMRDSGGQVIGASFRLNATIGTAGCALAFDRFGNDAVLGVGQYTVQSMQGSSTLNGTVYPTASERISTPGGGAGCNGSGCDGAAFVLSAMDGTHASGYFQGTVDADTGAGQADVVCTFWVKTGTYQP